MTDVPAALKQWWELVKPAGYLVLVVPDEDLYEQGIFPSVVNPDHKATFRIDKDDSWSPRSYDIRSLVQILQNAEIVSLELQDQDYDYALKRHGVRSWVELLMKLSNRLQWWMKRAGGNENPVRKVFDALLWRLGAPLDQTQRGALAQIQVVLYRRANGAAE